ncbi:uncharacterized protein [Rutidosis leptorrhynchoides]|uniref:uncharacterized protein n=1 Tax=Rutidosis leptorrhynchoides TaxID=125765 RepID=UPI003A996ECB
MGSACCVAARDRTITSELSSDAIPRNIRYSPSWNVRWDNRRRVAGEEMSVSWLSDGVGTNDRLDNKSQATVGTAYTSEEGSPLESFRNLTWQKSSHSEGHTVPHTDQSVSRVISEVKEARETQLTSEPSPTMMSSSTHSVSSLSASPLTFSQGQLLPPSRCTDRSPGMKSPNFSISEEGSNRGSHDGSSDGWSVPAFNELVATSHKERCSFDSESLNFNRDKVSRCSDRSSSSSPSVNMQTCGVCSKLLTKRSSFVATNEVAVVAILVCGHVYHAECLENVTSEINKYDPACPVCTFGEKKLLKLSQKAMKADSELNATMKKKLRSRVVDGDMYGDDNMSDRYKISGHEGIIPKMSSSSSMKPFLKRHFSFGSRVSRSLSENNYSRKKGFWAKLSRG